MAGRPVAARGGSGMLYGLIAFVIVAVASLGGFVWQLTANKALQTDSENKTRRLNQYGSPPSYYQNEASARSSSVFAVMSKDIEDLALLVTGGRNAVRPAIIEGSNALLRRIAEDNPGTIHPGDTLLTALKNLSGAYASLNSNHTKLSTELEEARLEIQSLKEGLKVVRDEFEQQMEAQREETARIEREKAEQLAAKDEQLAKQQSDAEAVAEELNRLKVELQATERNHDIAMTGLRNQLKEARAQIAELKPGGYDPYDILTKADGRVLRAIPGSDVIYIDLGKDDRIRPGLTFEVFSPTRDEDREGFRGKASVEVTAVLDTTAECRVTRAVRGRPIVEGDILVNIAYERNRLPRFVVRGDFDLDYDGETDGNGVEKVTAVIRAWGGEVVEQVDDSTDFMVVGMGPQVPTLSGDRPVSDVIRDLADSQLDALLQYQQDVERARTFYIPVITQSQFLFLTGYSGRGPILID